VTNGNDGSESQSDDAGGGQARELKEATNGNEKRGAQSADADRLRVVN